MIRVGFLIAAANAWPGVIQYYRNLWNALEFVGADIQPVALVGRGFDAGILEGARAEVRRSAWIDRLRPGWALRVTMREALGYEWPLDRLLRGHGIDLLSHSGPIGRRARVPAASWIPDFQHVRCPQFFQPSELRRRDRQFRRMAGWSDIVLLSSEDALRDLKAFAADDVPKARVLRFVADPLPVDGLPTVEELEREHGFSGPYFHLPNQFWKHKNHRVVVDALARLKAQGREVTVIATGSTSDYRWPGYFEELMAHVRSQGVEDRFRVLGSVPFPHVAALMRGSRALVNPSYFEGWSTTVEEAKSSGKRVLLSDIPVHREQDPPGGEFFHPDDPDALAELLRRRLEAHDPADDERLAADAASALEERKRAFGEKYAAIVSEAAATR